MLVVDACVWHSVVIFVGGGQVVVVGWREGLKIAFMLSGCVVPREIESEEIKFGTRNLDEMFWHFLP